MTEFTAQEKAAMRIVEQMLESGRTVLLVDRWSRGALRFMKPRHSIVHKHAVKKKYRGA